MAHQDSELSFVLIVFYLRKKKNSFRKWSQNVYHTQDRIAFSSFEVATVNKQMTDINLQCSLGEVFVTFYSLLKQS